MIIRFCKTTLLCVLSLFASTSFTVYAGNPDHTKISVLKFEVRTGERVKDFFARLEERGLISRPYLDSLLETAYYQKQLDFVPPSVKGLQRLEGIFIPQRYAIHLSDSNIELQTRIILYTLVKKAKERLARIEGNSFLTPYETLILTSIVEKEAAYNIQYQEVANALWTRQKLYAQTGLFNYRLGCCSTVEYVLGYHKPFLRTSDLQLVADSPYNTYYKAGLPPTPIAFFSDQALSAVQNAGFTNKTFFVMDWLKGRLYFNSRWEEHDKRARDIIYRIRAQYGKLVHQKMEGYYYDYFSSIMMQNRPNPVSEVTIIGDNSPDDTSMSAIWRISGEKKETP